VARRIALIRHGVTEANLDGRFIGSTDTPLCGEGKRQAENLIGQVRELNPDLILSSPMERAVATATIATQPLGMGITIDHDLKEVDFGRWEGRHYDEISGEYEYMTRKWVDGEMDLTFPGGESMGSFCKRVRQANRRMVESDAGTVVAFTHGGVVGQALCQLLDIPPARHIIFRVPPASITLIEVWKGINTLQGIYSAPKPHGV